MANVKPNYNKAGKIISYRFYAYIGQDEITGKKQQTTKTVPAPVGLTPAKALKRMQVEADNWESEIKKGFAPAKRFSFKQFIEEDFIPVHVCKGHSPSTVAFYKDICKKLVEKFGRKSLDSIRSIDIEKYIVELSNMTYKRGKNGKEQKYSSAHIDHFRTVLTVAFGFAEKHGMIERNPMRFVSSVKEDRTEVDFLSKDEAILFLSHLNEDAPMFWKTAMNLFIRTGIRRGELAGLKWSDIDQTNNTLTVCRDVINNAETGRKNVVKETKSAHSDRVLPIDPAMMALLKAWRSKQADEYGTKLMPSAFIFGSPIDPYNPIRPDSITQWLSRFNKRHGLRNVSPHDLRHTCATLLLSNGATVKETQMIMGHADASTTLKFYVGTNMEALKNASDRLSQALTADNKESVI